MDTSVTTPQAVATVIAVEGQAFARDPAGQMRPLQAGDVLREGDSVVTLPGGQVQLAFLDGKLLTLLPDETFQFSAETAPTSRPDVAEASLPAGEAERIIQALERGEDIDDLLDPTAAGLEGGGDNQGSDFVRLLRIAEGTSSTAFAFSPDAGAVDIAGTENGPANAQTGAAGLPPQPATAPVNTPPVANPEVVSLNEDGTLNINVLANDTDADGNALSVIAATATHGAVTLNPDGTLTYTPNPDYNGPDSIAYTISDGQGGTSSTTVSVTVNPVNDVALIGGQDSGSVTEDAALATSGTLTVADPDSGEASFTTQPSTVGAYGTFTLNSAGAWTYALDNANATVQALGAGDTLTETFPVSSVDGTSSSVTVTINGTNDAAVISSGTGSVTEDGTLTTGGTLTISDVDSGEASFVGQPSTAGAYGSFTLNSAGAWTYSLNNANAAVQALGAGDTLTETFTVSSVDGTTSSVVVTINGTNDIPVVSSGTGAVTEDTVLTTSGTLTVADADAGESAFQPQSASGAYGSFTLNSAGAWTYTLNNNDPAVQALASGDAMTEVFTVLTADGTATSVTITVNGTNESFSGDTTGSVQEDTTLAASGTLTATGGASFVPDSVTGTYGSLTLDAGGNWTYALNNAAANVQGLTSADTRTEVFTVSLNDGTTGNLVVTVLGLDDMAVIAGQNSGSVTEDATLATSGTLTVADPDSGEASFTAQPSTVGAYGSFTLNSAGAWTYSLNNANAAVQALGAGDTLTETFPVSSVDGTSSSVTVTINGTNDAAVISSGTGSVTEDGTLTTGGTLTISDADSGEASFTAQPSTAGAYGSFTLNSAGAWTYSLNNANAAVQALGAGDTLTETFPVSSVDGTTSSVVVTINGTNDAAVISSGTGSVTEDGTLTTGGTLTISDADSGEASFTAQPSTAGAYGSFTLNSAGAWTYSLNNANATVQALGAGDTLTETFTVSSVDGTSSSVTVTINGTNDAAVISSGTGSVTEDGTLTTGGTLTISDADSGEASFTAQPSTVGAYGSFTLNSAGAWTYALDNANATVQALGQGDTLTETFTVASVDGTSSSVTVTINGTNDAPIAQADIGTGNEDAPITGNVLANDTDTEGDTLSVTQFTVSGTTYLVGATAAIAGVGTLQISANGGYVFTPGPNWSGAVPNVSYTVADGNGGSATGTLTLNVTPIADIPMLAPISSQFILAPGSTVISTGGTDTVITAVAQDTGNGVSQANLEAELGLPAGYLDNRFDPTGANVNDPGNVDVFDGKLTEAHYSMTAGTTATWNYAFSNGENLQNEVANGYNDLVVLIVTDPLGNRQAIVVDSSETKFPSFTSNGSYSYTATQSGAHTFNWVVLNGRDAAKDSSLELNSLAFTVAGDATRYGAPVVLSPLAASLTDSDGSETLTARISGLPAGARFTIGTDNGDGSWTFTAAQLSSITLLPPENYTGTLNLTVTAIATETANGSTASTSQALSITIAETTNTHTSSTQSGQTLSGTNGNDLIRGYAGNDTINGNDGDDMIYGGAGNDTLNGGNGNDWLYGGIGTDTLNGGAGNDTLIGGAGNDTLTGGLGADVFKWELSDRGTAGSPAIDTVADFDSAVNSDKLDLRDLLLGESHAGTDAGNLADYLHFEVSGSNTVIQISSTGGFAGGYSAGATDQRIVLNNTDLTGGGTLSADQQIIQDLLSKGKLITD